ncbi:MAG: DUF2232 domain-containing protein [Magnetococcales bacterium]|nr:DUF2232 domain-containing protein [Magnetococcales bacterium]
MKALAENPILAGLLSALMMASPLLAPVIFIPVQMMAPLPLLLIALRRGERAAALAALPLAVEMALLSTGWLLGGWILLFFGGFPVLVGWMNRLGWRTLHSAIAGFSLATLLMALLIPVLYASGIDPQEQAALMMETAKQKWIEEMRLQPGADAKLLATMDESLQPLIQMFALLYPSLLMGGWFLLQMANLSAARSILRLGYGPQAYPEEGLNAFRPPFLVVWCWIAAVGCSLFAQGGVRYWGSNLALFLAIPFFFQGLAVIMAWLDHRGVLPFWRVFLFILMVLVQQLILGVILLGLFDTWFDFRARFTRNAGDQTPGGR